MNRFLISRYSFLCSLILLINLQAVQETSHQDELIRQDDFDQCHRTYVSIEISEYSRHRQHISRHQEAIRDYLRLRNFVISIDLVEFLLQSATRLDQTALLLSEEKQFLKTNKILYPSDDTLERLIITQREKARQNRGVLSSLLGMGSFIVS